MLSFKGRASRLEFWAVVPASWLAVLFMRAFFELEFELRPYGELLAIVFLPLIPICWLSLSTQVRRWHDRGKSGAWIMISSIPCIGLPWMIIELGFLPGVPTEKPEGIAVDLEITQEMTPIPYTVRTEDIPGRTTDGY